MIGETLSAGIRSLRIALLVIMVVVVLVVSVILASIRGTGAGGFAEAPLPDLPADVEIAGWVTFDKDSYLPGETARCRIRVLWRKDVVTPDFESFQGSVSFYPLDHRDSVFSQRSLSGGVREYNAEFILQAVNVDTTESYILATVTVYYTSARIRTGELRALRINPPPLHVGEYYPQDISDIPLIAPKPVIDESTLLRQRLMTIFGLVFLSLSAGLIWRHGRRRPESSLSEAERLWHEFNALQSHISDLRQFLLDCERIFLRALFLRAGISPTDFWSGNNATIGDWQTLADEARSLLSESYRPAQPGDDEVSRLSALVRELLRPLVVEERLQRELLPSFSVRLQRQPYVLATAVFLVVAAAASFALAAMPSSWVSSDVLRYNMAAKMLKDDETVERGLTEFSTLAKDAGDETVRAASLYNMGSLLVDPRLSGRPELQQRDLLEAVFLPGVTLDQLLHALDLDSEFELLGILADTAGRYVQAESAMKAAVRITPEDVDARRNLEILGKVRRALANTLVQLVDQGEQSAGLVQMQQQTIIDLQRLMEVELPEDFGKIQEGKDDTNYFILEQF